MKLLRYFMRGIEEVAKDLGIVKSVVVPKRRSPPRTSDLLAKHISDEFSLRHFHVFDTKGAVVTSTDEERAKEVLLRIEPLSEDADFLSLREKGWITLYKRGGFTYIFESSYQLDLIDVWVIARIVERYVWGETWEG